jgi:RNA polymerase sporulation-specific sigma factor
MEVNMKNKVEITGVNTQDLKTLSHEEMVILLKKVQEHDMDARDKLFEGNIKLILSVIKKFNNRGENLDDLFQIGAIGLLKAIDNFDLSVGVRFSTYAVPMIIGEIRRYLRDNSKLRISRSLKDIAYKSLQFKEMYMMKEHHEPTIKEIADYLNVEELDVILALEAIQEPVSIYTPIYSNSGDEIYLMDQIPTNTYDEEKRLQDLIIEEGLENLAPRLKNIIHQRYFENKTQVEIAEELGISQAQVSRLERSALKQILN